jgi:hypothetical protein
MVSTQYGTDSGEESTSMEGEQIMIQPLRTVHRRASMALALVLPTVLAVGLRARRPLIHARLGERGVDAFTMESKTRNSEARQSSRQSDHLWAKHAIHSVFLRDTSDPTVVQVVLEPLDDISAPDLLVYWCPELSSKHDLPTHAVLLGAFEKSKPLYLQESNARGFLILYSLAHQSVVDAASLESVL